MNSNVETTDLLRLLMKRALECHDTAASSDQLPDNTAQQDSVSSQPTATSTSGKVPPTGTLDRSAARQEIWLTFLQKYVLASAELESFISDQELQIETLKRSLVDQKAKGTVLERQLEDREKELTDRERNILKRESRVVGRERALAEREQVAEQVAKREQVVAEREQAALAIQEKIALEWEQFQQEKENTRYELLIPKGAWWIDGFGVLFVGKPEWGKNVKTPTNPIAIIAAYYPFLHLRYNGALCKRTNILLSIQQV